MSLHFLMSFYISFFRSLKFFFYCEGPLPCLSLFLDILSSLRLLRMGVHPSSLSLCACCWYTEMLLICGS